MTTFTAAEKVRARKALNHAIESGRVQRQPCARCGRQKAQAHHHDYSDIGMRMLEPHELLRPQFGRFADAYDLSAAKTKAAKVRLIGNSVCPEVAEAVVAANLRPGAVREDVA